MLYKEELGYEPIVVRGNSEFVLEKDEIVNMQQAMAEAMDAGYEVENKLTGVKDTAAFTGELVQKSKEKKILILRYGLYNQKAYTQREISKKLGISRSYVSRIESRAIKRMNECFMKSNER